MRRDMDKVLCERPRGGWRCKRRSRYRGPLEDAPRFESTSRNRGGTKWLGEHLGPLRRWLRRQVGRPWNDVYSELRANISPDNAVQMHIWLHAEQMVGVDVEVCGDEVRNRGHFREVLHARWSPVYVCPKTGVLKATPMKPRKRTKKERP